MDVPAKVTILLVWIFSATPVPVWLPILDTPKVLLNIATLNELKPLDTFWAEQQFKRFTDLQITYRVYRREW